MLWMIACLAPDPEPPQTGPTPRDTAPPTEAPRQPEGLVAYWSGAQDDVVTQTQAGLILMGGGREPDAAFEWWAPRLGGGDVVVLRASGSDGYNAYLYEEIGGVDSVLTLVVDQRVWAEDPWVAQQVAQAEGVFIAGGDQWDYLSLWRDTALQSALRDVHAEGRVLGGTSAGLAILGQWVFSAEKGTVYSDEALADPMNPYIRFEQDFLNLEPLQATLADSHFSERERLGRLAVFVARMHCAGVQDPLGIGVDEGTASLLGAEERRVVGPGQVHSLRSVVDGDCAAGEALDWPEFSLERESEAGMEQDFFSVDGGVLRF